MQPILLNYGQGQVSFPVEGAVSVQQLTEQKMEAIGDVAAALRSGFTTETIDSPPLAQLISAHDAVTIVISDLTRFWMRQDIICEHLVRYLHRELGVPFDQIVILIALGSHRKNSPEELRKLAGDYAYQNVAQVVDHDCDAPDLVCVGETPLGTQVWVNPLVVGRKVICISGTVYHIMAGYGGGRKSIVPGVAGRETIRQNHQHALDASRPASDPRVGSGMLSENPIHQDMARAAELVPATFGISVVANSDAQHSRLFCGDFYQAWLASCRYVHESYALPIAEEADVVIASCGGFPRDLNLYQATKTLFNAVRAVKKGGTLIFLAECREGGGAADFFAWNTPLREGRLEQALRADFTIGGYIFFAACEALRKANTLMLSEIDPEEVREMGITTHSNLDDLLAAVDFHGKTVAVLASGGSVMPQLECDHRFLSAQIFPAGEG